jgi:prolipoprotein diacylglyceryltransferase
MLLYGISRFIIEMYRGDPRGMVGTLSTSQFVSILIVPLASFMLLWLARGTGPEPAAARRARAA